MMQCKRVISRSEISAPININPTELCITRILVFTPCVCRQPCEMQAISESREVDTFGIDISFLCSRKESTLGLIVSFHTSIMQTHWANRLYFARIILSHSREKLRILPRERERKRRGKGRRERKKEKAINSRVRKTNRV